MAAPTHTNRQTPGAAFLQNGGQLSVLAVALDPDLAIWEKTLKPLGIDNGDKIDVTTQWNDTVRTYAPRALNEITSGGAMFAYNPAAFTQLLAVAGVNGSLTQHYPNGASVDFYGYIKSADFENLEEGTQPSGTLEVVVTNLDADGNEVEPVYNAPGTTTTTA